MASLSADIGASRRTTETDVPQAKAIRLALGMFDSLADLELMLADLAAADFDTDALCLAGSKSRLDEIGRAAAAIPGGLASKLAGDTECVTGIPGVGPLAATRGRFPAGASAPLGLSPEVLNGVAWRPEQGTLLLMVRTYTSSELAEATRLLLRRSPYHVHTREIVAPYHG